MRWNLEGRTLDDAAGREYPVRPLVWKLTDTVVRSALLAGVLALIGVVWEAFH